MLATEKHRLSSRMYALPAGGQKEVIELISADRRERFNLDLYRGRRKLLKFTFQNRARQSIRLVRLDLHARHTNPDGEVFTTSHLHVYREGFGLRWAEPVPSDLFTDLADIWKTLYEFMGYCNIVEPPRFQRDLFT